MRQPKPEDWMSDDHLVWVSDGRIVLDTSDRDDPSLPAINWGERVAGALPAGVAAWYVDRLAQPHLVAVGPDSRSGPESQTVEEVQGHHP